MARSHSFHSSRRTSRLLLTCLLGILLAGAGVYIYKLHNRLQDSQAKLAQASAAQPAAAPDQTLPMLDPTQSHALVTPEAPRAIAKFPTTAPGVLVTSTPTPGKSPAAPVTTLTPLVTAAPTAAVAPAPAPAPTAARPATAPARAANPTSRPAIARAPSTPPASRPVAPAVARGAAAPLLAAAKSKADAGDLMAARAILNEPLVGGGLSGADADAARAQLMQLNQKIIFSNNRFNDPYMDLVQVESTRTLPASAKQHSVPWEAVCRANSTSDKRLKVGQTLKVPKGPFCAVSKTAFRMDIYLGGLPGESGALFVASLPVGLGKDDSTPTGQWIVIAGSKNKNPDWTNPRTNEHFSGSDPKNPLGGYWLGLEGEQGNAVGKTSYGIHGTIEPDTIGKQASMGCIRLRKDDIALVYDLLSDGKSRVLVTN